MSAAVALLARLEAAGVVVGLSPDGAGLSLQAATAPAPDLLAEMRRLKPEIVRLLAGRSANDALPCPQFDDSEGGKDPPSAPAAPAMRRLDLYRRRAADATSGDDPEREALMAEEAAPTLPAERHAETVAALLLAASPLAGVPGAVACRSCQRGIWCSPSWRGPAPRDLCAECWASEREAGHERNP